MAMIEGDGPAQEPEIKTQFNETREAAMLIPVGEAGVELQNFAQQVDYAKWMAAAGFMIPKHLRNNVGACLAVLDMSQRWGFSPFQVARMTYDVNGNVGLMAQLVHAVIDKFAPLQGRLRIKYEGEGPERVCIVTGRFKGEIEDCEYRSPTFAKITPKNSPLWTSDADQQQAYLSVSRWARRYSPGTLMGLFSKEELEDAGAQYIGPDQAKDVTPAGQSLADRLKAKGADHPAEGYRDGVVEAGLNGDLDHSQDPADGATQAQSDAEATEGAGKSRKRVTGKPAKAVEASEGEPKAAEPAPEPVKASPEPEARTEPAKLPTNVKSYTAWLKDWLANFDTAEDINDRWSAEKKLRNACGVTAEDREPLEKMKAARIKDLAKA